MEKGAGLAAPRPPGAARREELLLLLDLLLGLLGLLRGSLLLDLLLLLRRGGNRRGRGSDGSSGGGGSGGRCGRRSSLVVGEGRGGSEESEGDEAGDDLLHWFSPVGWCLAARGAGGQVRAELSTFRGGSPVRSARCPRCVRWRSGEAPRVDAPARRG